MNNTSAVKILFLGNCNVVCLKTRAASTINTAHVTLVRSFTLLTAIKL